MSDIIFSVVILVLVPYGPRLYAAHTYPSINKTKSGVNSGVASASRGPHIETQKKNGFNKREWIVGGNHNRTPIQRKHHTRHIISSWPSWRLERFREEEEEEGGDLRGSFSCDSKPLPVVHPLRLYHIIASCTGTNETGSIFPLNWSFPGKALVCRT